MIKGIIRKIGSRILKKKYGRNCYEDLSEEERQKN